MQSVMERPRRRAGRAFTGANGKTRPLSEIYPTYFEVREALTPVDVRECLRIRYNVYCLEHDYESGQGQGSDIETDKYDARSKHAALYYRRTGAPVGTVRMIYPHHEAPEQSFVLQTLVDWSRYCEEDFYPVLSTGEISRFCVTKNFRRRLQDSETAPYPSGYAVVSEDEFRRVIPNMTLGLIEWLVRVSVRDGLSHWCAVMEPALLRLLARLGIHFEPIGDLVEFHGARQPCVLELAPMLERMKRERADVWNVVTAQGAHAEKLQR